VSIYSNQRDEEDALRLYDRAYELYEKGNYRRAETQLNRLVEKYPHAEVIPLSLYLRSKIRNEMSVPDETMDQEKEREQARQETLLREPSIRSGPPVPASVAQAPISMTSDGVRITVAQVAGIRLRLSETRVDIRCGTEVEIPFLLTNTGNGQDRFALSNNIGHRGMDVQIIGQDGMPLLETPTLRAGESVEGRMVLGLSQEMDDERLFASALNVVSLFDSQIRTSSRFYVTARRPILLTETIPDRAEVMPGQELTWTVRMKNVGSVVALGVSLFCQYPGELSLAAVYPEPISKDDTSRQLVWHLEEMSPAQQFQVDLRFKVSDRALFRDEIRLWNGISCQLYKEPRMLLSEAVRVGYIPGITLDLTRSSVMATPGETLFFPIGLRNGGNGPGDYDLKLEGIHGSLIDENGKEIHSIEGLAATGQVHVRARIDVPKGASDGQRLHGKILVQARDRRDVMAQREVSVEISAPRLEAQTSALSGAARPGADLHYVIQITNHGSGLAKDISVRESFEQGIRFVSASPLPTYQEQGVVSWRIPELAPNESLQIVVQGTVASNLPAGTILGTRTALEWHDPNGNIYP